MFRGKIILMFVILFFSFICNTTSKKDVRKKGVYIDVEHPQILGIDKNFFTFLNLTCYRRNRSDRMHYCNLYFNILQPLDNKKDKHVIIFYQLLSNKYKRSFVDLSLPFCDACFTYLSFFKTAFENIPLSERPMPKAECPLQPGYYRLENMTVSPEVIPKSFPFDEGRIFYNVTHLNKAIVWAFLDFKIQIFN